MKFGKSRVLGTLQYDGWQKIYETTLTSAATSLTISGLTGNSDIIYRLRARFVNGYNGTTGYRTHINNDSGNNYGFQRIYCYGTTVGASQGTAYSGFDGGVMVNYVLGSMCCYNNIIYAKSGYVRTAIISIIRSITGATIDTFALTSGVWNNSVDEITSLVFLANQTNGFGIGTYICLERLVL